MKIMAIDLGESRTGLAVCDKFEMLASPAGVIHNKNVEEVIDEVAKAVKLNQVEHIIVGYPKNMNNTLGERAEKSKVFAQRIHEITNLPVELWDERSTTVSAINYLNNTNTRGKKRKNVVDAVAATIILESFLNWRKLNQKKGD